ncbi:hypothetical protein ACWGI8_11900, partial [Streptomyces sp. NPDC054841]
MRTTARLLTGHALAAVCLGVLAAPASYAGDFEPLEITPSTVSPGATVTVRTTGCGKGGHGTGDAQSLGAGDFKLSPLARKETVAGKFTVPKNAKPGNYGIAVLCDDGKEATGDLVVQSHGQQPSGHVKTG